MRIASCKGYDDVWLLRRNSIKSPKERKRRLGRRPVLTEEEKRMVRKIAREEIEMAFR